MKRDFKVAVFTLTKDRLPYTKKTFDSLHLRTKIPVDHVVVDNGSNDGTVDYLEDLRRRDVLADVIYNECNKGISIASNQALDILTGEGKDYDFIVKLDNDCEILTDDWLRPLLEMIAATGDRMILSPHVLGIFYRAESLKGAGDNSLSVAGHKVTPVNHLGGICLVAPASAYRRFRFTERQSLHGSQDVDFSYYIGRRGFSMAYVDEIAVKHIDSTQGQIDRFPDYFQERRDEEETLIYGERRLISYLKRPFRHLREIQKLDYLGLTDKSVGSRLLEKGSAAIRGVFRGLIGWRT